MIEWLENALPAVLGAVPALAVLLVFLGGVVTSIGPCNAAMVPLIMAYVGGQENAGKIRSFWLSLFFVLGNATTFTLMGVVIALIGGIFGFAQRVLYYIAAFVCLLIGLNLLKALEFQVPWLSGFVNGYRPREGLLGAYILGVVMGATGSQCGTPILVAILTIVMMKGDILYGAVLLFFYALGRGVLVAAAGTFTGLIKDTAALARWSEVMEKAAGAVLLIIGIYFLWVA